MGGILYQTGKFLYAFFVYFVEPTNSANFLVNTAKDECSSVIGKRTRSFPSKLSEPTDFGSL